MKTAVCCGTDGEVVLQKGEKPKKRAVGSPSTSALAVSPPTAGGIRMVPEDRRGHEPSRLLWPIRVVTPYRATNRVCNPRDGPLPVEGTGLSAVLERLGVAAEDVVAVGDAPNDLSVFELVGWSVAVGGAFPELQAVASVCSAEPHGATFPPLVDAILAQKNIEGDLITERHGV